MAIAAYCFFEKKPAIDVNFINDGQLTIFWFYVELTLFTWARDKKVPLKVGDYWIIHFFNSDKQ